jgi:pilus assembly protein CpaE
MLTALGDINEKLKAFELGADDFMPKPFQPKELQARVKVHLRRSMAQVEPPQEDQKTKIIAVFSLRGGVGVSTLAANLAVGLAQLWQKPTLLIDLAFQNGQTALLLDLALRNTWSDLVYNSPEEMDEDVLKRVLLHHESGVDVLAAPKRIVDAERITGEHVAKILTLARTKYQYAVLDMPHDLSASTLAGLDSAESILLVLSPEIASVRCASVALDVFGELGYNMEQVHILQNWVFQNHGLARKDIESAIRRPVRALIPHMPDDLLPALMVGKPIVLQAATSPAGALFEDLAYHFSREDHKEQPPAAPSPALLRLQERRKRQQKKR